MTPEQLAVANALISGPRGGIRGPFQALLRNPRLADRVRLLGDSIRFENSLPPALREFTIVIVARFWSARYEWHAHSKLAVELGVSQETIDAIGHGRKPAAMSADEALVYGFLDESRTSPTPPMPQRWHALANPPCWTSCARPAISALSR